MQDEVHLDSVGTPTVDKEGQLIIFMDTNSDFVYNIAKLLNPPPLERYGILNISLMCYTLYRINTAFFLTYGLVEDSRDIISPDKSLAKSGDMKQAKEDKAIPESYKCCELRSFRIIFVVSIKTSVSL